MKSMLQVIGFADGTFAEGEGPTAVEFIGWQRADLPQPNQMSRL
jgi:hypothetical protein